MKSYIPHRILVIDEQGDQNSLCKCLFQCYILAFDWANRMGLEGKRVFDLLLVTPNYDKDPLNIRKYSLWCKIECNEEQQKSWEEKRDIDIKSYFGVFPKERE